eukprot:COSAG02_NODE_14636_length_1252_cov_1.279271_1_plen_90_part_00
MRPYSPVVHQGDELEVVNPTFEEGLDDTGLRNRKLGDEPAEEPDGEDADGAKSADTGRSDVRSKSNVVWTLAYYSLGIASQVVVYTCMW